MGGASGKQIYQWLQEQKLGIDGLTGAQGDVKKLVDEYNQLADDVQTGVTKLEGMWTGKAAGAAGRGAGPLGTAFRSAAPHLSNAQGSLSDQAESFTTASNAVVQVPDEPSAPDGLDKVGRWFSGGTVFGGGEAVHQMNEDYNGKKASYDAANQKNIDTYNTFSSSTDSHVKALPKDYGTVPQSVGDLSISADSGSGSGPGASGGPAVHGGGSGAGGAAGSGGSGGSGYSYGGYGPGGTSAASSGGGGSAPGSHYGGYRPGGSSAGQRAAGQGAPAGQGTSAANTSGAVPEGAPGSFGGAGGRPGDQASSRRSGSAGGFGPEAGAAIGPMGAGGAMGAGGGDQPRSGRPFGSAGAQMGGGSESAGSGRGGAGASAGGARSGVGGMAAEEAAMRGGVSGGAAGKAGASGMPMGGARGAKGGEDEEHSSPGYLVSEDNGSEIVGELPMTAPPVIGE